DDAANAKDADDDAVTADDINTKHLPSTCRDKSTAE
ncbi:TPA: prepilin-type cleavage/methylation domain-containing protein, partial [Neisseria gonorrhoeae]